MLPSAAPAAPLGPSRWKPRVLAVLTGTVLALLAFVVAMQGRSVGSGTVAFQTDAADLNELLAERNRAILEAADADSPLSWRLAVPQRVAKSLFPMRDAQQTYDEHCYYRYKAGHELLIPWPEHPKGRWYVRTNDLGLREDADTPRGKLDLRVLVTGDSHTDGVCDNSESFANLLEAELAARHPGRSIDVANAGKGGYAFHNYLGVLERFIALDLVPDVFVVAVYGGNDFDGVLVPWRFFAGVPQPTGQPPYWDLVEKARAVNEPCLSQGVVSIKMFQHDPAELERALEAALGISGQIVGTARSHGVVPLFVYLPSWYELDPDRTVSDFGQVLAALELGREDVERFVDLADRYVAGVRALGADVIDMRERFRGDGEPLYWRRDHHINLAGHARVAEALLGPIEDLGLERP